MPQIGGLVPLEQAHRSGKLPALDKKRNREEAQISKRFREVLGPEPRPRPHSRTAFESEPSIYDGRGEEDED